MRSILFTVLFVLLLQHASTQAIDVQHYKFQLQLTDASDSIKGMATITLKRLDSTNQIILDLASISNGKGMQVSSVTANGKTLSFTHVRDTLFIPSAGLGNDSLQTVTINYSGIPADGLIISKNKWGARTFFADNWPNRAHQWLPCNDRPDDKALVEFEVLAPSHYKVISNGVLQHETDNSNNQKITYWKENKPIPTKVMVIGASRFAVKSFSDSTITPVSAWVYPQDSTKGFYDYSLATSIVKFFSDYIGEYPFEKLANVQSKTIFGGMENASCIFYAENTVTGTRSSEALLAHEIAHQWFGNSTTEKSFAHLWLSEGFATYLTHLYLEQKYGRDTLVKRLQEDRKEIIQFIKQWPFPVVDSTSALMDLLNANSYQKGGWVLHMLRQEVGDSVFQNILRTYYDHYKYSNADTWDFEKVAEEVSRKDLKSFFQQWLFTPGVPELKIETDAENDNLTITVYQQQDSSFTFPLTVEFADGNGHKKRFTCSVTSKTQTFRYHIGFQVDQTRIDPDCRLLFTGGLRK